MIPTPMNCDYPKQLENKIRMKCGAEISSSMNGGPEFDLKSGLVFHLSHCVVSDNGNYTLGLRIDAEDAQMLLDYLSECLKHKDWKWPKLECDAKLNEAIAAAQLLHPDCAWDRISMEGRHSPFWSLYPELKNW